MARHAPRPLGGLDEPLLPPREKFVVYEPKCREWLEETLPHLRRMRLLLATIALAQILAVVLSVGVPSEEHYTISRSREDIVIVSLVSASASLIGAALPTKAISPMYWLVFISFVLSMAKAIAFDWGYDDTTAVVIVCSIVGNFVQLNLGGKIERVAQESSQVLQYVLSRGELGMPPQRVIEEEENTPKMSLTRFQLLGVMKPYFWPKGMINKMRCFVTYMFLISAKVCNLVAPIFIGRAVQLLSEGAEAKEVYPKVMIYSTLVFSSRLCNELQNVTYLGVKQNAFAEIAERSFAHVHSLSMEWHVKKKLGQTLRSLDRGIAAADTVVSYLFLYLGPSCLELVATGLVFYKHFNIPSLSALVFTCFVAYVVATIKLTQWRKKFRESTNRHDNDFHEKATDSLQNYETVKFFTAEKFETDRYVDAVRKYQSYSVSMQVSLSVLNATQQLILNFCALCALSIAAYHVSRDELELGSFVSVQVYVASLFAPLSFLGTIYNAIVQAFIDMQNLSQLLAEHPDVQDVPNAKELILPPSNGAPSVEFRNVSFRYPSQDKNAGLKNISFVVPGGTETALVGRTGSGKSSLFRLLFRLYNIDSGAILIAGQDIHQVTMQSLRSSIGVVPQDTVLFNETILFNVRYGNREATMEQVEEACRKAQILDKIRSLPQGFDTPVGASGAKLSGGERQRISIARCLLKDAPILVLDEFSSALDGTTEVSVHQAITTLSETSQRTVLVIAHRLSTIKKSDQIIVLDDGIILERGKHEQLLEARGRYFDMWNAQLQAAREEIEEEHEATNGSSTTHRPPQVVVTTTMTTTTNSKGAASSHGHGHGGSHGHGHS